MTGFIKHEDQREAGTRMVKTANGTEYAFRWCPPGTFLMGSPEDEESRYEDETRHEVTLAHGFWMLETPVTQAMWQSVMGDTPSYFKGDDLPVECVSWNACQDFCGKLSRKLGLKLHLPTEAQWEYACRAGSTTPFSFGETLNGTEANCNGNYPYGTDEKGLYVEKTTPVRSYAPNAWGLYDMHGNVWEWCEDRHGDYPTNAVSDPIGSDGGMNCVGRGGSWRNDAECCRSAFRGYDSPGFRSCLLGFRVVACPDW